MTPHPERHWLPLDTYFAAIERETRRFREVLVDQPEGRRVPSCPEWDVDDLLWHLGGDVQHFWAWVIAHRPEAPDDYPEPERPADRQGIITLLDRSHDELMFRLRNADPADGAWSWASDPNLHTVAFTIRRQAHEALVHRVDAELTAGQRTEVDQHLASDGVAEVLEVMYGGTPRWGRYTPDGTRVAFDLTDTGHRVTIGLGRFAGTHPRTGEQVDVDDIEVVEHGHIGDDLARCDLRISDTAERLYLWLWHRATDDAEPDFDGDADVEARLREILGEAIN